MLQKLDQISSRGKKGPKPAKGKSIGQTKEDLITGIDSNMLKVLLNTSDSYRQFCFDNNGAEQFACGSSTSGKRGRIVQMPKPEKSNKYCKFDLFTDELIGLGQITDIIDSDHESLIEAAQDEDYMTDSVVMRNTKKLCKKDLLDTYKALTENQLVTEKGTRNYKYQVKFGNKTNDEQNNN